MSSEQGTEITVVVVDDHHAIRLGLEVALSDDPGIDVVASAGTCREAVEAVAKFAPDVVICDLDLPDGHGVDVIAATRELSPTTRVLVLTGSELNADVRRAIRAGAGGYVRKDTMGDKIAVDVRSVHRGGSVMSPDVAAMVISDFSALANGREATATTDVEGDAADATDGTALTEREMQILELAARGLSNAAIATEVGLRESTVKNHMTNVMEKLHATSRTAAAAKAHAAGLIDLGNLGG